jgi:hypothetical protein
MPSNPKYRRPLNSDQVETLELLYKFRFGSVDLIREYFNKSSRGLIFSRLKVLEEQGFIAKRFDSSYRIQGKPAAYYLLPAGARKLQETHSTEDEAVNIKSIYKDKTISETFIQHSLNIFCVYNQLKAQYGDELAFFTKTNLASYEHFPKPFPDAFTSLETKNNTQYFFVEILEDTQPFFTAVRGVKKYLDHKESGEWTITETDYPTILFICESISLQKRLQKQIAKMLNASWVDDLIFATTTKIELRSLPEDDAIWQSVTEPDEKLSLRHI